MIRRAIGRFLEWALTYEHEVIVELGLGASMPFHKYPGDAGYDLYCREDVNIPAGATREVSSGVYIDPRDPIWMEIKARSSTLRAKGLEVVDAVIDRDYRGEMKAVVHNPAGTASYICAGERVVQLVPHRLIPLRFQLGRLSPSARSRNGYGSTGS